VPSESQKNGDSSEELDGGNSIDSTIGSSNTPKSKGLGVPLVNARLEAESNPAMVLPPANVVYKYFIGKGNNSIMVRSLFKNRFWWF